MIVKAELEDFLSISSQDVTDVVFITNLEKNSQSMENDIIAFNVNNSLKSEIYEVDFDHIVDAVVASMSGVANLPCKGKPFIEPSEIESIKQSLDEKGAHNNKVMAVKKELTEFQRQIKLSYAHKVKEYNKERIILEKRIEGLEAAKKKIVNERLSKMLWPYNESTRQIDAKVTELKIQAQRFAKKASDLLEMRPAADEKDLLMFKNQLKEKFAG